MLDKIKGLKKYADCSIPTNENELRQKESITGYNKAIEDVIKIFTTHSISDSSFELIEQLLQNHLKAAGRLTRCDLDEQSEHELGLDIGRNKLAIKEFKNLKTR